VRRLIRLRRARPRQNSSRGLGIRGAQILAARIERSSNGRGSIHPTTVGGSAHAWSRCVAANPHARVTTMMLAPGARVPSFAPQSRAGKRQPGSPHKLVLIGAQRIARPPAAYDTAGQQPTPSRRISSHVVTKYPGTGRRRLAAGAGDHLRRHQGSTGHRVGRHRLRWTPGSAATGTPQAGRHYARRANAQHGRAGDAGRDLGQQPGARGHGQLAHAIGGQHDARGVGPRGAGLRGEARRSGRRRKRVARRTDA